MYFLELLRKLSRILSQWNWLRKCSAACIKTKDKNSTMKFHTPLEAPIQPSDREETGRWEGKSSKKPRCLPPPRFKFHSKELTTLERRKRRAKLKITDLINEDNGWLVFSSESEQILHQSETHGNLLELDWHNTALPDLLCSLLALEKWTKNWRKIQISCNTSEAMIEKFSIISFSEIFINHMVQKCAHSVRHFTNFLFLRKNNGLRPILKLRKAGFFSTKKEIAPCKRSIRQTILFAYTFHTLFNNTSKTVVENKLPSHSCFK